MGSYSQLEKTFGDYENRFSTTGAKESIVPVNSNNRASRLYTRSEDAYVFAPLGVDLKYP